MTASLHVRLPLEPPLFGSAGMPAFDPLRTFDDMREARVTRILGFPVAPALSAS